MYARPSRTALALFAASAFGCASLHAASVLEPLQGFGTNGWVAPGANPYITTSNTERGMGWNPVTGNLIIPSRNGGNFVAVLNGRTGSVVKTLDTTGVSGGTLAMMGAAVDSSGAIYVSNLQSGSSALSPFKIYKWNSESDTSAPSIAFSKVNPQTTTGGFRFGDSFDVMTSGTNAIFAVAGSTTGTSGGLANNGNFMVGSLDGTNQSTVYRAIPGTLTASNDYRSALTFVDANTVIGNQGTSAKVTDFVVTTDAITNANATITNSITLGAAERGLDYTELGGRSLLATINTNTSMLSVYDITDLNNVSLLASGSTYTGPLAANANATSGVRWGDPLSANSQILYGMSSNQGVQAMVFTLVPEPTTALLGALGTLGLLARRRR